MKWNGNYPVIHLIENKYQTGIKLDKRTMDAYEKIIEYDSSMNNFINASTNL